MTDCEDQAQGGQANMALERALAERDALAARCERLTEALRGLLECPYIADRDTEHAWRCPETDVAESRARAALSEARATAATLRAFAAHTVVHSPAPPPLHDR